MIWTVAKPVTGRLICTMPFDPTTRHRFNELGIRPKWDKQHKKWLVSRDRMPQVLHLLHELHGPGCVVVRGNTRDVCDIRCQRAKGFDCVCSCASTHHGSLGSRGWTAVGDMLVRNEMTQQRYTYTE